jgi:hypothetical protein
MISTIERGSRTPSFELADQLLSALGWQLRLELEPLDADIDRIIEAAAGQPLEKRLATAGVDIPDFIAALNTVKLDYVIDGAGAGLLQGAPVPVEALEIVVSLNDLAAFASMLERHHAKRWDANWLGWGYISADPREEGPLRWQVGWFGELRASLVHELPPSVTIDLDGTACRVRPLIDVEVDDPAIARILDRVRARLAASDASR